MMDGPLRYILICVEIDTVAVSQGHHGNVLKTSSLSNVFDDVVVLLPGLSPEFGDEVVDRLRVLLSDLTPEGLLVPGPNPIEIVLVAFSLYAVLREPTNRVGVHSVEKA